MRVVNEILRVDDMTMDRRGWRRIIVSPSPHHIPYFDENIDYVKKYMMHYLHAFN